MNTLTLPSIKPDPPYTYCRETPARMGKNYYGFPIRCYNKIKLGMTRCLACQKELDGREEKG